MDLRTAVGKSTQQNPLDTVLSSDVYSYHFHPGTKAFYALMGLDPWGLAFFFCFSLNF